MTKLLIIRFSALGDVAIAVPIVRALAEQYPSLDITMLSRCNYEPLFHDMPVNVHFYGADLKHKHYGREGLDLLLKEIDFTSYDKVADLHGVLRSDYISFRMRLHGILTRRIHKNKLARLWLCSRLNHRKKPLTLMSERYLRVFSRLGYPISLSSLRNSRYCTPPSDKQHIGIAPFAAHTGKIYPLSKMEQVVALLGDIMAKRGEEVLLFGAGPAEKATLELWAKKYNGVTSMVGKYPLDEDIRQMATLRLMLTMDSGNMHLAALAGTRCLSIWGATDVRMGFRAYGQKDEDLICRDLPCRPCSTYGNVPCRYGDYRCLEIEPKEIVERILSAL